MTDLPATTGLPQWVVDLKHIPGAASAVARLIGSSAHAGSAWIDIAVAEGEARARRIRDNAEARSVVTKAAADAVAKGVGTDQQLAERAIEHFLGDTFRKQENREAVAAIAAETITHSVDQVTSKEGPSDDWMNVFSIFAERASSDTLRQHWAQILVGEIRKPGSINLQTLQFMSIIDQPAAELIMSIAARVTESYIIITEDLSRDEGYERVLDLDSLGFLSAGRSGWEMTFDNDGKYFLPFKKLGLALEMEPGTKVTFDIHPLTKPGRQLLEAIDFEDDVEAITRIAETLKNQHGIRRAQYGRYIRSGSSFETSSLIDVWPVEG